MSENNSNNNAQTGAMIFSLMTMPVTTTYLGLIADRLPNNHIGIPLKVLLELPSGGFSYYANLKESTNGGYEAHIDALGVVGTGATLQQALQGSVVEMLTVATGSAPPTHIKIGLALATGAAIVISGGGVKGLWNHIKEHNIVDGIIEAAIAAGDTAEDAIISVYSHYFEEGEDEPSAEIALEDGIIEVNPATGAGDINVFEFVSNLTKELAEDLGLTKVNVNNASGLQEYTIHHMNGQIIDASSGGHMVIDDGVDGTLSYANSAHAVDVDMLAGNTYLAENISGTGLPNGQAKDVFEGVANVTGSLFSDKILADEHANKINGLTGADTIDGGDDNNTIKGGSGADSITAGTGHDVIYANVGGSSNDTDADYIDAGAGNDAIYGTGGGDTLIGGAGDDYLSSKGGATLMGGAGVDTYSVTVGDVIIDADGGRFNGASFVQGGEHIWHAGTTIHPFKIIGGTDLYVYTGGLQTAPSDTYFVIKNFANDGSWGFTIAPQYWDAKNEFVIDVPGAESPDENVNPEDSATPLSTPTSGHPNENPSASNPTLNASSANEHEHGYTNYDNYFMASAGYDTQEGGAADDIFEWGSGFHYDVMSDSGGSNDTIKMLNLNEDDVKIEQFGNNIRVTAVSSPGVEKLTIRDAYIAGNEIETIAFADGSTLDLNLSSSGHTNAVEFIENADFHANDSIVAQGGDDTIKSWHGNDFVDAGAGDDSITGRTGNNTIFGGEGNDLVRFDYLSTSNNDIDGGAGDDWIFASKGLDTLTGGTGDDTLEGYLGDDVYIWGAGDGNDLLKESNFSGGGSDILKLIGGITLADLDIFGSADYGLKVVYVPTGEEISIHRYFYDTDYAIETIEFDDGSTHALSTGHEWRGTAGDDVLSAAGYDDVMYGYAGNDTIDAWHGDDTIEGGLGDDHITGDAGNDTYVWNAGDGNDGYYESNSGGADTIHLTGGITLADLEMYGEAGADDLLIKHVPTGEVIRLYNQFFNDADYWIETLTFDDGTTYDLNQGTTFFGTANADNIFSGDRTLDDVMYGYEGNDTIDGGRGNDTIEGGLDDDILKGDNGDDILTGGLGVDTLYGGSGNDTYFWAAGDGNDDIVEASGTDTLRMTGGITASDLTFVGGASQNLEITYTPTGEVITIGDHHYHSYQDYRVETIEFDDGSTYSLLEGVEWFGTTGNDNLKAGRYDDTLTGDAGDDTLSGYDGNDSLIGGTGNDTLYGYTGDDTYVWQSGDGNDVVAESWNVVGGDDTIHLTGGVTSADVALSDNGDHRIITHTPTGETIQINYQNHSDNDYHVETLTFDDNSALSLTGDTLLTWDGSSGADTIQAGDFDSELYGHDGDDSIIGGAGDDRSFGGDGNDTIIGNDGVDTLRGDEGSDVILGGGGDDRLLGQGGTDSIEGGEGNDWIWGNDDLGELQLDADDTLSGGNGDDTIIGDFGDDIIIGGTGKDLMRGEEGIDTFVYNSAADSGLNANNEHDVIQQFSQTDGDQIDFSGMAEGTFTFLSNGNANLDFTGAGNEIAYRNLGGSSKLFVDVDGDNITDMEINFVQAGGIDFTSSDFVL